MFLATLLATLLLSSTSDAPQLYLPKSDGSFRIVTYNVGGFSKYTANSIPMVAAMILECGADAVSLNEVHRFNPRHNYDQPAELASALGGWAWHFGDAMNYNISGYGNAVMIAPMPEMPSYATVPLRGGIGHEKRCIAVVETSRYVLGSVHLDQKTEKMRMKQVKKISEWAEGLALDSGRPVFLCGDFNDFPDSGLLAYLEDEWELLSAPEPSFPSDRPAVCIDYIFRYKNSAPVTVTARGALTRFESGDVSVASDHVPIFVDVIFSQTY